MKTVYFYSTPGCHLCDVAWDLLARVVDRLPLRIEEVDIAESDALIERYGVRIPVIKFADVDEDLGWPFHEVEAWDYFQRFINH